LPEFEAELAKEFDASGGRPLMSFAVRRRIRVQAKSAGFGITEIMLLIQVLTLLWTYYKQRQEKDPDYRASASPETAASLDEALAIALDTL